MTSRKSRKSSQLEILVAEDSPTQAELLRHLLQENDYAVTVTSNGKQALEAARRRKPTLIISDVVMPEMDGYSLCKAIKDDKNLKDVPVIIVTSLSGIQDIAFGLDCGVDNFIRKPYDNDALISRIDYILSNRKLRKSAKMQMGLEVVLAGKKYYINSEREQILDLLVSSYEEALQLNGALQHSEREVRALNASLESRAAELEAANRELEAFSHSVSHDLRGPLRRISAYSSMLEEEYGDRLEGEGRDYLQRLRDATKRMSQLIDDLLKLSRVTRAEMRREGADLTALALEILSQLQSSQPGRQVDVHVERGMRASCDPRLIRIALENLLGNAWKFTGKRNFAHIEFGVAELEGVPTYFVRDNGSGFDMAHADNLFSPFTRLHSDDDFPGTGVGLATVQRIVHRHGGRLFAQAEVEKGAEFYFTLEPGFTPGHKDQQTLRRESAPAI
ncbi:MAG TPA: response regulator [Lysobacter sp.]|jgi:hypothetical protein|nr:response regulator [Lysobacter sp.]